MAKQHDTLLQDWRDRANSLEANVSQVILGQEQAIRLLTIAVFARGHVLLEGDVGVGKTTLLRAFARGLGGAYERIEGSVDLLPNDLIYYTYVSEDGKPQVAPGPLLKHADALSIFFFNEINRARPQIHSLLLRAMAERTLSAFNRDYQFPHLQVFADRNRVEREETFELPSAARDRFLMEILVTMPEDRAQQSELMFAPRFHDVDALLKQTAAAVVPYAELNQIAALIQTEIQTSETLRHYALELCRATHKPGDYGINIDEVDNSRLILAGISPRGMSMLMRAARVAAWLQGRSSVMPEDIHSVFFPTVAHRIFFQPVYEMRRAQVAPALLAKIMARVAAP